MLSFNVESLFSAHNPSFDTAAEAIEEADDNSREAELLIPESDILVIEKFYYFHKLLVLSFKNHMSLQFAARESGLHISYAITDNNDIACNVGELKLHCDDPIVLRFKNISSIWAPVSILNAVVGLELLDYYLSHNQIYLYFHDKCIRVCLLHDIDAGSNMLYFTEVD